MRSFLSASTVTVSNSLSGVRLLQRQICVALERAFFLLTASAAEARTAFQPKRSDVPRRSLKSSRVAHDTPLLLARLRQIIQPASCSHTLQSFKVATHSAVSAVVKGTLPSSVWFLVPFPHKVPEHHSSFAAFQLQGGGGGEVGEKMCFCCVLLAHP